MTVFFSSAFAENNTPKVVVVGAGLAGLTAAYRLQQNGADVHIYEARNRVGGRILTVKINDALAELGGQYITDGGDADHILRLIGEFGLELREYKISLDHSYFTGEELIPIQELMSEKQFKPENLKAQLNDLKERSKNMREVLDAMFEEEGPLYKTLAVRLAGYEGAIVDHLSSSYVETLYHMLLGGVAPAYSNHNDENLLALFSIKQGNSLLPESLAKKLNDRLYLNHALKKVSKQDNGSYILTFDDDQKVQADILVLTMPCSVYKSIIFEENVLPSERLEAIKSVQYGTNAKLIVPFLKSSSERKGFFNDHIGTYLDIDSGILTMYYTGETGRFSEDTISDSYRQNNSMLELGFGDTFPPFATPAIAKDQPFASYDCPVGYSWPNDPYAKGSYSYIAPGQETLLTETENYRDETVKTLFSPIDQTLYFAGEHTSILLDIPGTMEAACESGERTARMILNLH